MLTNGDKTGFAVIEHDLSACVVLAKNGREEEDK